MAEGARLESVYTFTGIGGSNPSLSASFSSLQESPPELAFSKPFPKITIHREKFICLLQSAAVLRSYIGCQENEHSRSGRRRPTICETVDFPEIRRGDIHEHNPKKRTCRPNR